MQRGSSEAWNFPPGKGQPVGKGQETELHWDDAGADKYKQLEGKFLTQMTDRSAREDVLLKLVFTRKAVECMKVEGSLDCGDCKSLEQYELREMTKKRSRISQRQPP